MKIVHLTNTIGRSGSGRAAYRIHESLLFNNIDSAVLSSEELYIKRRRLINLLDKLIKIIFFRKYKYPVSFNFFSSISIDLINNLDCDIVHLHWINSNFISIKDISKIRKKIVWTVHDAWPLNSVEHIHVPINNVISRYVHSLKLKYWKKLNILFISPSNWMNGIAKESKIGKISQFTCIPNPIDVDKWKPLHNYNFEWYDPDNIYLLYISDGGSKNNYKGYDLLMQCINSSNILSNKVKLLIVGDNNFINENVITLGNINDDKLLMSIYTLSSITLVTSRFDNFPNILLESMSCGTPIVAFNVGGISDVLIDKYNGQIVQKFNIGEYTSAINSILTNRSNIDYKNNCIETAINFSYTAISKKYISVYNKLINEN